MPNVTSRSILRGCGAELGELGFKLQVVKGQCFAIWITNNMKHNSRFVIAALQRAITIYMGR